MNETLSDLLASVTSRRNTDLVATLLIQRPELLPEVMKKYLNDADPAGWRAAWAVDIADQARPGIAGDYFSAIIRKLPEFTSNGVKRNSLRMLSRHLIKEEQMGELMSVCFKWLISPKETVAVKVHAMEVLYSISCKEPDLKQELADSIEWRISEETPGFRAHGMKILKKLHKEMIEGKFNQSAK